MVDDLLTDALWAAENWRRFAHREWLARELRLLDRLFPTPLRRAMFGNGPSGHQLYGDLVTEGGRTQLLELAAELLRLIDEQSASPTLLLRPDLPIAGRLRHWRLYLPTKSELLVAPILRPTGRLVWQPQGSGHGADYQVIAARPLVAEVKRVCASSRAARLETARGGALNRSGRSGPRFTRREHAALTRADIPRLYRRVRHAARQLATSAAKAAARRTPGVLFLDLDGNPYLANLRGAICSWMTLSWARPIDLVMFFSFGIREDRWGTVAEAVYARTWRALEVLVAAHGVCNRGHVHVGNLPNGACAHPVGF